MAGGPPTVTPQALAAAGGQARSIGVLMRTLASQAARPRAPATATSAEYSGPPRQGARKRFPGLRGTGHPAAVTVTGLPAPPMRDRPDTTTTVTAPPPAASRVRVLRRGCVRSAARPVGHPTGPAPDLAVRSDGRTRASADGRVGVRADEERGRDGPPPTRGQARTVVIAGSGNGDDRWRVLGILTWFGFRRVPAEG